MRAIMGWVRKARMMAREFQDGVEDVVRQADLEDVKKEVTEIGDFELGKEFKDRLGLSEDLDVEALESDVESALSAVPDTAEKPASVEGPAATKTRRRAKKTTGKAPARKKKAAPPVRTASPAKSRTAKKGTEPATKASTAKASPAKAAARPTKTGKAARPKRAATRRPSRGTRAPAKTGA